jgi:small basic protein
MLILERFQRSGLNPQFNTRIFFISLIFGLILGTLLVFIIEAIGGLIGVALFEKRALSAAHTGAARATTTSRAV